SQATRPRWRLRCARPACWSTDPRRGFAARSRPGPETARVRNAGTAMGRTSVGRIRIGCAGWSIPGRYAGLFGEGDSALARYAMRFDVAEINSSFYRPHQRGTWQRWAATVPRGFRFSVKLPQEISHELGLRGAGPALDRFLAQVDGLGGRLGGFLL